MNAYIGWVVDLETNKTVFARFDKLIAAKNDERARRKLLRRAQRYGVLLDLSKHHPVIMQIEILPEVL